jgi:alkyldihydroxyacetonephosphate synthase
VDELPELLAQIVGADQVLTGEQAAAYAWDALGAHRGFDAEALLPQPLCVVRPVETTEVAEIVKLVCERGLAIVPFGGGSGLMGGAVAVRPSILIDTQRMNRVLDVDACAQIVRVQAGATIAAVNEALAPHGLFCGHDPWTVNVATVGGTISTDSLGYLGARYGSMGDQVLGLTVVLPDGTVVSTTATGKSSVGPDLKRLFIGGEGCFGVITEATLRVFPVPGARRFVAFGYPDFETGFRAVLRVRDAGIRPAVLDFGDDGNEGREATLILGFEGDAGVVAAETTAAAAICSQGGGRDLGEGPGVEYWERRHDIGDRFAEGRRAGITRKAPASGGFDFVHVSIPTSRILDYRSKAIESASRQGVRLVETGLWCLPELFSAVLATDGDRAALGNAVDEMLRAAIAAGGSIEYCHGVGLRLAHLMDEQHGDALRVLRGFKGTLDPAGTMNPGKLAL